MGGAVLKSAAQSPCKAVPRIVAAFLSILALTSDADAARRRHEAPKPFNGRPYWLGLAECGGIYFKLKLLYTDAAVHARVVHPDARANAEFTRKLNEAIRTATTYFDAAERFLMADRGVERADAVLTYQGQARAAGERLKTPEAALAAAKACPVLYHACRQAFPKQCSEHLAPAS
jgi:hypothetical protein